MSYHLRTACRELKEPYWDDIKWGILDLPYSDEQFLILEKDNNNYMQTCVNEDFKKCKLYTLEIRQYSNNTDFKQYQILTNDVMVVLNNFRDYFNDEKIQLNTYNDISDEF